MGFVIFLEAFQLYLIVSSHYPASSFAKLGGQASSKTLPRGWGQPL